MSTRYFVTAFCRKRYAGALKIALDATYSLGRNLSGVGVYSRQILQRLPRAHPGPRYLFCYRPHRFLKALREPVPANAHRALLYGRLPGSDLFHAVNQRVDAGRHRKVVTTFHDLFTLTAEYATPEFRRRFSEQARHAAERSDLIITVSRFTAQQVEEILEFESQRIRVIYHGVLPPDTIAAPVSREPLIVFVGALQKRKNVVRLVRAFERTEPGWRLVLAGSQGYGAQEILTAVEQSPRRSDILITGYLPDGELERLYARASIFAFPSLDEGFGMPVLDAMARGIPVVTSNRSGVAEIAGEAALKVNPTDVDGIAAALQTLMEDSELRNSLTVAGRAHAARFSWDLAAEQTWEVYRELLPL